METEIQVSENAIPATIKKSTLAVWLIVGIVCALAVAFITGLMSLEVPEPGGDPTGYFVVYFLVPIVTLLAGVLLAIVGWTRGKQFPQAKGAFAFGLGVLLASLIPVVTRVNGFLTPVPPLEVSDYALSTFSIEATVREVTTPNKEGESFIYLEGTILVVRTKKITDLPKVGQKIKCYGKAYRNNSGGLTMEEYYRSTK